MKHFNPKETKITLLTIEQAKRLPKDILACSEWWWLRSPGGTQDSAAYVRAGGDVGEYGYYIYCDITAVRPAFEIANLNSEFGEKIYVGKLLCTVIDKDLVLADECVCCHRFDSESNDWETSELKAFIESEKFAEIKTFSIILTETFKTVLEIEACSVGEALDIAERQYHNGDFYTESDSLPVDYEITAEEE